ncbi:HD domain-containing protein [Parafilimonas terrae]|uniref:Histidine kinase-, DNA gyrase B-, and HSP90-like ATPase n=1 Tax=Parafilimonas terrae TaxID=1465490 RepID=A0A1I5XFX8_9BACT|nr:ATP-binding protein [Parafilimonas terrae]SFQ30860.1 Histidine kinase-, DNA gyrase B-, and HSP90-like ATPase [Parafilimonas terrae]
MNIDTDYKLDDITLIKHLKDINSPFVPKIYEVYEEVKDILNSRVQFVFPNYTLHNTGHSFRIMEYMSKLVSDYKLLDELEITLLIYAALLHDIGMAISDKDITAIKADDFPFCDIKFSTMKKLMGGNEELALQEYVRRIHASLSGKYIIEELKEKLLIPKLAALDFAQDLALICEAHTWDYDRIKTELRTHEIKGDYKFNSQFIAAILRLADILDIDGNRTPYNLYKLIAPKGISDDEWKQHYLISNNEKITVDDRTQQKKIVFHGKSTNASIHRKLLIYIGWVKDELINAVSLVKGMIPQYNLVYDTTPEVNIQTEGYTFSDYKMTLEFKAISSLLMGEKIYGSRTLGLRELVQNSIDSCKIRQEAEKLKWEFGEEQYQPKIKVILDKDKNQAIIKDNGTGMSINIIKKHFLNIGVSYYNSTDFLLKDFNYRPIGNFGIGFLSCFMLSNDAKVTTRDYGSKYKYTIELEKGNEYTSLTQAEDVRFDGTEVVLNYSDFISVFNNDIKEVHGFLSQYFLTDGIVFELIDKSLTKSEKIVQSIALTEPLDKGLIKIDFKDYLKEVEGYALIKKKRPFIKQFDEIDFDEILYKYDDEKGLVEIVEPAKLKIDDYINGTELKYFSIPLVESNVEDDFLNGLNFTGDVDEVITKMENELTWVSIIVPKDRQEELAETSIDRNTVYIFDNLETRDLHQIGHSKDCETKAFVKKITLFEGRKNTLYLPFNKTERDHKFYWWKTSDSKQYLFMRSVLIKDFNFDIDVSASIFEISSFITNITSKKFIPDISRNNVDAETRKILNYIIGKAIHLGARDNLDLDKDEKQTLENFIRTYYDEKTEYEI